ncbi:transglycosylase SLT domain-containing protein [Candidatus Gracilibacteria bacterium]|nr:transglycosylase SLT domain-containing protein [Candidatus Gracilibacteria bacterium]
MSNVENKQSTVEKKTPQENFSQVETGTTAALNKLEAEQATTETIRKTDQLKNEIDKNKYEDLPLQTYNEVVKGTELEQRILKVMSHPDFENYPEMKGKSPEQRAEYLFRKINVAISRFYARKFGITIESPVPEYLYKVIVPATEWFLMDILRGGQENNIQFLGELGKMNIESFSALFNGVRNFSQKFSGVYSQVKKLMMVSDFLSLPQQRGILDKLKNPYDFYQKLMKNPVWDKENLDIRTLNISEFSLQDLQHSSEELQNGQAQLAQGLEMIRSSIGGIQMVDSNPNTVKKLLGIVDSSDKFFEKTEVVNKKLFDAMDKFGSIERTLQSFGLDIFETLNNSKLVKGVLNFVFGLLGFSGGLDGVQRGWRRREIEKNLNPSKREFISDVMKNYSEKKEKSDFSQQIVNQFKVKIKEQDMSKLNLDMETLKGSLLEKLNSADQLNVAVLDTMQSKSFFVERVKNSEGKEQLQIKSDFFSSQELKQKFIDEYFQIVLPKILGNDSFIRKIKSSDDLAFALTSGIAINVDTVVLGMKADALLPSEFFETKVVPDENKQEALEKKDNETGLVEHKELKGYDGKLMRLDEVKGLAKIDLPSFQKKVEDISKDLEINPNWLMTVMFKESGLDSTASNKSGAAGLIQFMPKTLQSMKITRKELLAMSPLMQLDYVKKFYEKNKGYNSLKDLYLEAFFPAARKYSNNPDYVFESPSEGLSAEKIAKANPGIAPKGATRITMKDFDNYVAKIVDKNVPEGFQSQFV